MAAVTRGMNLCKVEDSSYQKIPAETTLQLSVKGEIGSEKQWQVTAFSP